MKILETYKGYLIKTSIGADLRIEEDELPKALKIWGKEEVGKFRQGYLIGKFIALIIEDKDREIVKDFNPGTGKRIEGMRPLRNVFEGSEVLKLTDKKLLT